MVVKLKSMWKQEREIKLVSIDNMYQIKDTHSTELDNIYFINQIIATDMYNKKIEEVFNGSQV